MTLGTFSLDDTQQTILPGYSIDRVISFSYN